MKKISIVVGARPNFIKIAPLVREMKAQKLSFEIVHTGQHYDFEMSQIFFKDLSLPKPDFNLEVGSGPHGWQTGKIMERLEALFLKRPPNLVIVVGDVNSTLAGALVSAKLKIPIAHIEAGLRSFDREMPEEINRKLTDHLSTFLFCPTKTAVENLKREGIRKGVYLSGDVMYDAFLEGIKIAQKKSKILEKLNLSSKNYFLATIHRAENTDKKENLKNIVEALCEIKNLVFPCHPRTEKYLKKYGLWKKAKKNLILIEPVGYIDMLWLEKNAKKILTDSGGVQKEAFFAKVPCITLRERTEWVETVREGWNILVGTDKKKIKKAVENFDPKSSPRNVFGRGNSAKKIVKILSQKIKKFNL